MKRAKQSRLKPRNRLAASPLLAKGGAHQARGKKASRARCKFATLRTLRDEC